MVTAQYKVSFKSVWNLMAFILIVSIPAEPLFPRYLQLGIAALLLLRAIFGKRGTTANTFLLFSVAFIAIATISLCYTPEKANGFDTIKTMLNVYLTALAICNHISTGFDSPQKLTAFIMNSFCVGTVVILIYTMLVERSFIVSGYWRLGKLVFVNDGTFMVLSYSIIVAYMWSIFCVVTKKGRIYYLLFAFLSFSAVLSGTKKTFVVFVMAFILCNLLSNNGKPLKLVFVLIGIAVSLIIVYELLLNVPFLYRSIGYRIDNYLRFIMNRSDAVSASSAERYIMREYAIKWFGENPIMGNGISAFRAKYAEVSGRYLYSHCNYTEILCNHGLIGFTIYYGYYLYLLIKLFTFYFKTRNDIFMFFIIFMLVLMTIDYGQVSYYRLHYMLIVAVASMCVSKCSKTVDLKCSTAPSVPPQCYRSVVTAEPTMIKAKKRLVNMNDFTIYELLIGERLINTLKIEK